MVTENIHKNDNDMPTNSRNHCEKRKKDFKNAVIYLLHQNH